MNRPELKGVVTEVDDLVRDIRPLLRGHHRSVQWAVLAELVALWMIEHAAVRSRILEPLIRVHVDTVRKLVDSYIAAEKMAKSNDRGRDRRAHHRRGDVSPEVPRWAGAGNWQGHGLRIACIEATIVLEE